jgi:hypothetical protein
MDKATVARLYRFASEMLSIRPNGRAGCRRNVLLHCVPYYAPLVLFMQQPRVNLCYARLDERGTLIKVSLGFAYLGVALDGTMLHKME